MIRNTRTSEEGSIMLSTFYLILFVSFLTVSLAGIIYNQMMQLKHLSDAYEAKALIEVSGHLLEERLESEDIETAILYYSEGIVKIRKESAEEYSLVATLANEYTSSQRITVTLEVESEERLPGPEMSQPIVTPPVSNDTEKNWEEQEDRHTNERDPGPGE